MSESDHLRQVLTAGLSHRAEVLKREDAPEDAADDAPPA